MGNFDFISGANGEAFRSSLESDYSELKLAKNAGMWKSVHVLSGSIIEALLLDFLTESGYRDPKSHDLTALTLGELVVACKNQGVLSDVTVSLSKAVQNYRNLIHPGRVLRLNNAPSENSARVVEALVGMIADDIAKKMRHTRGYTAEQIATKIEQDSSFLVILENVLKDVQDFELQRLLINVLPQRYFDYLDDIALATLTRLDRLRKCFRPVFECVSDQIRTKATQNYVLILKEEREEHVLAYEIDFFRSRDLKYLAPSDVQMVVKHLLARLKSEASLGLETFLAMVEELGGHLEVGDADEFADIVVMTMIRCVPESELSSYCTRIWNEYTRALPEVQGRLEARVDAWTKMYEDRGQDKEVRMTKELRSSLWDIPF